MEQFVKNMLKEEKELEKRIKRLGHCIENKSYNYDKEYDQELTGKCKRLGEFIDNSDIFKKLSDEEKNLDSNQYEAMKKALVIVHDLKEFNEDTVKNLINHLKDYKNNLSKRITLHS